MFNWNTNKKKILLNFKIDDWMNDFKDCCRWNIQLSTDNQCNYMLDDTSIGLHPVPVDHVSGVGNTDGSSFVETNFDPFRLQKTLFRISFIKLKMYFFQPQLEHEHCKRKVNTRCCIQLPKQLIYQFFNPYLATNLAVLAINALLAALGDILLGGSPMIFGMTTFLPL